MKLRVLYSCLTPSHGSNGLYLGPQKGLTTVSPVPFKKHTLTHKATETRTPVMGGGLDNFVTCRAVSPLKRRSQLSALQLFGCPGCGWLRMMPI